LKERQKNEKERKETKGLSLQTENLKRYKRTYKNDEFLFLSVLLPRGRESKREKRPCLLLLLHDRKVTREEEKCPVILWI
jgi:hypothetical protein